MPTTDEIINAVLDNTDAIIRSGNYDALPILNLPTEDDRDAKIAALEAAERAESEADKAASAARIALKEAEITLERAEIAAREAERRRGDLETSFVRELVGERTDLRAKTAALEAERDTYRARTTNLRFALASIIAPDDTLNARFAEMDDAALISEAYDATTLASRFAGPLFAHMETT